MPFSLAHLDTDLKKKKIRLNKHCPIKPPMLVEDNEQLGNTKLIKIDAKTRVGGKGVSYFS